jgi:hypothetical protein
MMSPPSQDRVFCVGIGGFSRSMNYRGDVTQELPMRQPVYRRDLNQWIDLLVDTIAFLLQSEEPAPRAM